MFVAFMECDIICPENIKEPCGGKRDVYTYYQLCK